MRSTKEIRTRLNRLQAEFDEEMDRSERTRDDPGESNHALGAAEAISLRMHELRWVLYGRTSNTGERSE